MQLFSNIINTKQGKAIKHSWEKKAKGKVTQANQ